MAITAAQLNVLFTSQGADRVKGDLQSIDDSLNKVGTAYAAVGAAGVGGLGLMVNASMQLESAMANVDSIAGLTESQLASLTDQVQSLSAEMGKAPTEMADALYEINSSGFEAADAMLILEKSSIAAGAGLTTVDVAATATTAVLNAYGQGAEEAGNVTDVLFKTVDSGVITFEALARNLGQVLPIASALGVEIEELGAAYAQMTLQGISAAQSETAIAAVMRSALNETEAMTAAVKEYGYASAELLIQTEGLVGYLEFLAEASGGSSAALTELLGTADATVGALALMKNEGADFNAMLSEMEGAASDGAYTLGVFETQTNTTAFAIDQMVATLQNAAVGMGDALSPGVRAAAESLTFLTNQFNDLPESGQAAISTFAAVASASSLALGSLVLIIPKIAEFRNAMLALRASGTALGLLAGSMGPVALGLGALAAGAVLLTGSFDDSSDASKRLEGSIISLGDVISNLRLSHMDEQADMVQAFQIQAEGVKNTAEQYHESQALIDEAHRRSAETGEEFFDVLYDLNNAYSLSENGAERLAVAQDKIGAAFTDSRIDHEALSATLTELADAFSSGEMTYDEYAEGVIAISNGLENYRAEADAAVDTTNALATSMDLVAANAGSVGQSLLEATAEAAAARAEFQALTREWISGMLAATDMADALSQWTLGTNASDAAELANNLSDASNAADSMFRVIVGGTNAIKSNADAILSWADNLIAVRGEWSRLDELVQAGLITGTSGVFDDGSQYAEAQNAYDSIAESVGRINDNLDAVQAIQAPLMAEMTASTAAYTDELLAMEPAQQMVALAWMDSTTSAQAMELALLGASAASGELGANGMQAFESMALGAANANPALAALLVDMQILEEHVDASGNKTYTVNTAGLSDANNQFAALTNTIADLIDMMDNGQLDRSYTLEIAADTRLAEERIAAFSDYEIPQPVVEVAADTGAATSSLNAFEEEASAPITKTVQLDWSSIGSMAGGALAGAAGEVAGALGGGNRFGIPETIDVAINGDASDLFAATEGARSELSTMPKEATVYIYGDESGAMTAIGNAGHNLAVLDGSEAMLYVLGDNSDAMAAIADAQAYDGSILATAYVDIVARQIGSGAAIGSNIVAGARSALGIRSPSREFEEIGKYTAMGFNQGFEREFSEMNFGYSASAVASPMYAGYGAGVAPMGGGTFAPVINNYITPNPGMDEGALVERAVDETLTALEIAHDRYTRSMGGSL